MGKALLILAALAVMASPACAWHDGFAYPNGPLAGNDGWDDGLDPDGAGINVTAQVVQIGLGGDAFKDTVNIATVSSNTILCTLYAFPGVSGGSNIWAAWFNDSAGLNWGRWYGSGNTARPRIGGYAVILDPVNLVVDEWNKLEILVDQAAQTATFYHNGALLGTLDSTAGGLQNPSGGVSQVQLENFGRADVPNDYIYVDDMSVVPEPGSLLALTAFGVGMLGYVRRRR